MRTATMSRAALVTALFAACGDDKGPPVATGDDAGSTSTPAGTVAATDTGDVPDSTGVIEPDSSGGGEVGDGAMGDCSLWEQDCPDGDKCSPWSDAPDLMPDDIRCCPEKPGGGVDGDSCTVQEYFGSCLDDCAKGHMCFDLDNDGKGTCQKFCAGDPEHPKCELDETCFIYFAGIPFCFPQCDPLVQDCYEGDGCYPDDSDAGGTGFICLPTVGGAKIGDPCWLLSNCAPGLLCVTPDFVPDCPTFAGCCSALCDISEPDTCEKTVGPGTECIPWYYGGQMPPQADLENVGACAVPP